MARVQLDTDGNELEGEYESGIVEVTGFKRRRWYHRRDFRFVAFVIACIVAFQSYGFATGPGKVTDKLKTAMISDNKMDVLVWAKFPAEAFHMEIYQELGALSGEQDGAVRVGGVMPQGVEFLARKYWIDKIDLAPPSDIPTVQRPN
ncbi:MAG: hypothetical protein CBD27_06295 [Rhodospirillaceae bacterium TMED167]|nr:hypothetical protein [Rhodospirillaceae bacterium]OUW27443.1 MAG: hypothetical protein CBD27_06295 [Rhodospirillaceae bacterium TMED167]